MDENKQLVSIIIPIFNVEAYLSKCISSISEQTYKNLEIILVDDGSTDKSYEICEEWARVDHRIVVIHKKNGGLSDARNAGLNKAKGEYVSFIDSDDFIHPKMIQILLTACIEYASEIAICGYKDVIDDNPTMGIENCAKYTTFSSEEAFDGFLENRDGNFVVAWNKLYSKNLFNDLRYPKGKIHEDCFTTYRLLLRAKKVVYVDKILYFYRYRPGSIMRVTDVEREYDIVEAYDEIKRFIQNSYSKKFDMAECQYILANLSVINKAKRYSDNPKINICRKNIKNSSYLKNKRLKHVQKLRAFLFCSMPRFYIRINNVLIKKWKNKTIPEYL